MKSSYCTFNSFVTPTTQCLEADTSPLPPPKSHYPLRFQRTWGLSSSMLKPCDLRGELEFAPYLHWALPVSPLFLLEMIEGLSTSCWIFPARLVQKLWLLSCSFQLFMQLLETLNSFLEVKELLAERRLVGLDWWGGTYFSDCPSVFLPASKQ